METATQTPLKSNNSRNWCSAFGCNSDSRKRRKYGFMADSDIEYFPFPTEKKAPKIRKKWLDLVRRVDYVPKKDHRLCSKHFVEGRPTKQHPYPELFSYNNYKKSIRPSTSIQKMDEMRSQSIHTKLSKRSYGNNLHDNGTDFQDAAGDIGSAEVISQISHPIFINDGTRDRHLPVIKEIDVTTSSCNASNVDTVDVPRRYDCFFPTSVVNTLSTQDHTYIYNPDIEVPEMSNESTQTTLTMKNIDEMESQIKNYETIMKHHFGSLLRKKPTKR